jgi:hypothetical protein
MTFFNKKTEVMQIEMTPYGRYLYSIGKFKPHSYEFADEDILYRASGSTEAQEAAHTRIISETPKLKINRAFQDEAAQQESPPTLDKKRFIEKKMDQKQNGLFALGRSSYSSDRSPAFQVTMLQGAISGSEATFETNISSSTNQDIGGVLAIPQVDIDLNFRATLKNTLNQNFSNEEVITSETFDDGTYVQINYTDPIIHLKEFNSFYEKENFEIEVFQVGTQGQLSPLKMTRKTSAIINGMLVLDVLPPTYTSEEQRILQTTTEAEEGIDTSRLEYFFEIEVDEDIAPEILCAAVDKLEINSQFLDEDLICPDQRTDRFDIYATRVGPEDLEDCD